jgi:hypothetical protein
VIADTGVKLEGPVQESEGAKYRSLSGVHAYAGGMELDLAGVNTAGSVEKEWIFQRNDAEGLIPGKLLRKYHMIFNYPERTLTFARAGSVEPRGEKIKADIGPNNGFPRIEVEVARQAYGVLLDTGASFTMISRVKLDEWSKANPTWPTATGATAFANMIGGKMESDALMMRIPEMKIGSFTVRQSGVVSRPDGTFEKMMSPIMTAPIIGSVAGNVLCDFRVEIDYQNGLVYLTKTKRVSDPAISGVGLVLAPGKSGLIVSAIASTAAADVKKGVHPGDELIAVDGVSMAGKPLAAAALALQGVKGMAKGLTLLRNGESVSVTVTCASLL